LLLRDAMNGPESSHQGFAGNAEYTAHGKEIA